MPGPKYVDNMFLLIATVCEAHTYAKHANTRGSGGMPPENFENLTL